jgi:hypothetical protein
MLLFDCARCKKRTLFKKVGDVQAFPNAHPPIQRRAMLRCERCKVALRYVVIESENADAN